MQEAGHPHASESPSGDSVTVMGTLLLSFSPLPLLPEPMCQWGHL